MLFGTRDSAANNNDVWRVEEVSHMIGCKEVGARWVWPRFMYLRCTRIEAIIGCIEEVITGI
jgi:hypothetical protein